MCVSDCMGYVDAAQCVCVIDCLHWAVSVIWQTELPRPAPPAVGFNLLLLYLGWAGWSAHIHTHTHSHTRTHIHTHQQRAQNTACAHLKPPIKAFTWIQCRLLTPSQSSVMECVAVASYSKGILVSHVWQPPGLEETSKGVCEGALDHRLELFYKPQHIDIDVNTEILIDVICK